MSIIRRLSFVECCSKSLCGSAIHRLNNRRYSLGYRFCCLDISSIEVSSDATGPTARATQRQIPTQHKLKSHETNSVRFGSQITQGSICFILNISFLPCSFNSSCFSIADPNTHGFPAKKKTIDQFPSNHQLIVTVPFFRSLLPSGYMPV